jgi:hypothetical protein
MKNKIIAVPNFAKDPKKEAEGFYGFYCSENAVIVIMNGSMCHAWTELCRYSAGKRTEKWSVARPRRRR